MTSDHKSLIEFCKKNIEEVIHCGSSSEWTQRDFDYLSKSIFEKTKINLSISTLKRLWKNASQHAPHHSTLDALARYLDYDNWGDFRIKNIQHIQNGETNIRSGNGIKTKNGVTNKWARIFLRFLLIVGIVFLLSVPAIWVRNLKLVQPQRFSENDTGIVFNYKQNVPSDLPNTVVFYYDISQAVFDSAFIQQDWDYRRRMPVLKENRYLTSQYFYPGFFEAKLILNDRLVRQQNIFVTTNDWLGLVRFERYGNTMPVYLKDENLKISGNLYVSTDMLRKYAVNLNTDYFISYYNVRDFGEVYADNFILKASIKNNILEGGKTCQYSEMVVKFDKGRILIPFSDPGCTSLLNVSIGENYVSGRDNDLSAFGCDLSGWQDITLEVKEKNVKVFINGKEIFSTSFTSNMGKLHGLHFLFHGCGAVDNIQLFNADNQLVYRDSFEN